jgi:inositol-phosphate phosphatase/L-galactose 1-phosphate phosphatase/histidinol-phosphatase
MTAACPDAFLSLARALAATAGAIVRGHFRTPVTIGQKADLTPVTIADREAEAAMRRLIEKTYPDHGIIGEEAGAEREGASHVWVLDPVDGTKRFITGNPLFGTLIALLRDGAPILGVIDMPILGERWIGASGHPTLFEGAGERQVARVRPCPGLAEASLYATSPQMFVGRDFDAFERVRQAVRTPLFGGDCYSYGLLTSGHNDLVIEAHMAPHDYLAQVPVVTGAGGFMTDWQGAALGLGSGHRVLAAGDARCHGEAIRLLQAD